MIDGVLELKKQNWELMYPLPTPGRDAGASTEAPAEFAVSGRPGRHVVLADRRVACSDKFRFLVPPLKEK